MAWRKAPLELVALYDEVFPEDPRAERRKMFGFPAGFVNGNMFSGLWQEFMILRLGEVARHEFLKLPKAEVFEPMPGRPMREYVVVPPAVMGDRALLRKWLGRAFAFAADLAPKKPRAQKAATKRPTQKAKRR